MAMPNNNPASGPTLKWLHDLIVGKDEQGISDMVDKMPPDWEALFRRVVAGFAALDADNLGPETLNVWFAFEEVPALCQSDAGRFIDQLKLLPWASKKPDGKTPVTEAGMYKLGDTIYKVQENRAGTGLYAKRLVIHEALVNAGSYNVSFQYESGAVKKLSADDKLSYEDAKAFGALYGTCCCCGRLLTNELSIALGIGPICGSRQFGGDFKFMIDAAKLEVSK